MYKQSPTQLRLVDSDRVVQVIRRSSTTGAYDKYFNPTDHNLIYVFKHFN